MLRQFINSINEKPALQWFIGIAIVSLSLWIGISGYEARTVSFDNCPYVDAANDLMQFGKIPTHGHVTSLTAFAPPGTTYLTLPGAMLFDDPRFFFIPMAPILFALTLLGIFLLGRLFLSPALSLGACVLFAFSTGGISIASSLWPVGHPVYFVWVTLLCVLWVKKEKTTYLGAALLIYLFGMNVFMSIAPLILIPIVLWVFFRPKTSPWPILLALFLGFIIWLPYLSFDSHHGFANLTAQLTRTFIQPENYSEHWCNPDQPIRTYQMAGGNNSGGSDITTFVKGLPVVKDSMAIQNLLNRVMDIVVNPTANLSQFPKGVSTVVFLCLMLLGIAGVLVLFMPIKESGKLARLQKFISENKANKSEQAFVYAFLVVWIVLVVLTSRGRPERFWQVWPGQVLLIVMGVSIIGRKLKRQWMTAFFALLIAISIFLNPMMKTKLSAISKNGWAGKKPEIVLASDFLGKQIRDDGHSQAQIGYKLFFMSFQVKHNIVEPRDKVGREVDTFLLQKYNIRNLNSCAEGHWPGDQYLMVQAKPENRNFSRFFFDPNQNDGYTRLAEFGKYSVWKLAPNEN